MAMVKIALLLCVTMSCIGTSYSVIDAHDPLINCHGLVWPEKLTKEERKVLKPLIQSGWTLVNDGNAIRKNLDFKEFGDAAAFMTKVGLKVNSVCHYPLLENLYKRVNVTLYTWSKDGITMNDVALAKFIDVAAALFLP
uniref:putative pterin-4-alpha-carbinolamine dehydratase n=1 Tax=Styela clava TaxID=7725 RepID=UPI001939B9D5|nr:putative pterin-4-alpha-carbinolamine dehydratase [Styela clava]